MPRHSEDYRPLLVQHLKSILESGLLLDEDYEVLLQRCSFTYQPPQPRRRPWEILVGGMAALVSWKCRQPKLALSALLVTIISICVHRRDTIKLERRREIVDALLKGFLKVRKLHVGVVRYMKMRKSEDFGAHVQEFVRDFMERSQENFAAMLTNIDQLVRTRVELQEDFKELKHMDLNSLLASKELNAENCQKLASRVQDISTLLSSKFLSYLGLVLSIPDTPELERLLDQQLPRVKLQLDQLHTVLQKEFNNLRYCAAQKVELSSVVNSYFGRQLSGKLQQTVIGAVNNLSLVMEKSHTVLSKVQETDDMDDVKKLEATLYELRNHALVTYESLDVLCRLYGVLTNQSSQPEHVALASELKHVEGPFGEVHFDDDSEVKEEDFELFIPADQDEDLTVMREVEREDQSRAHLGLMLKELQQSLQQHERFVAARSKRGGAQKELQAIVEQPAMPRFDLDQLKAAPDPAVLLPSKENLEELTPPPPPAPPPLKQFHVATEGVDKENPKSMFEGIKTLSAQLRRPVDVFGDDDSD